MKVAVSSSTFGTALRRGDLTHLEWVAAVASRLDVEGAIFAYADLPRTDAEYAAQVKKIAIDLGIVPVALDAPGLLDPERGDDERADAIDLASALGAGLIRTTAGPPGDVPPQTFARTVVATKTMVKRAKQANVTLALAAIPGSLLPALTDVKHLAKDVDSAWLRYDVRFDDAERASLGPRERVLVERVGLDDVIDADVVARRGWFALEGDGGNDPFARVGAAIARLRIAEARARLATV